MKYYGCTSDALFGNWGRPKVEVWGFWKFWEKAVQ
jgi:hypothetical protein